MKTLNKELKSTIKLNIKRYISIIIIIFLGVAFYVGMKINPSVLQNTMISYQKKYNYADFKVTSLIGLTNEEIVKIKKMIPDIVDAEGKYYKEVVTSLKDENKSVSEYPISVHSYSNNYRINKLKIEEGKSISSSNQCLVSTDFLSLGYKLGDKITLDDSSLKNKEYTIVGFVRDPQYIANDKNVSTILGGIINYAVYVDKNEFNIEDGVFTFYDIKLKEKYKPFTNDYNNYIENTKKEVLKKSASISKQREKSVIGEKTKELENAQAEYNEKKQLADAEFDKLNLEIQNAEKQIKTAESKIMSDEEIDTYLNNVKISLDSSKTQLDSLYTTLQISKSILNTFRNNQTSSVTQNLSNLNNQLDNVNKNKENANNVLKKLKEQLSNNQKYCESLSIRNLIDSCNRTSNTLKTKIQNQQQLVESYKKEASELNDLIEYVKGSTNQSFDISKYDIYVQNLENDYNNGLKEYSSALASYNYAKNNLKNQMHLSKVELDSKKQELENAKTSYETNKKQTYEKLEEAYNTIIENKKLLNSLGDLSWTVITRSDGYGYGSFYEDTIKINNLSKIFPIMFFIVAWLITATSITRLIQEERSKIGILKSLGYNKNQIIVKYIKYSFSADLIGVTFGILVGVFLFPTIISKVYETRYYIPEIKYIFDIIPIIQAIILSLISTVLVAFFSVINVVKEKPAALMRPKVFKNIKIKPVRRKNRSKRKLTFVKKVTYRNIFINPWRSIMTITGVIGCTALIISSFGTRDSIKNVISIQFNKIYNIDTQFYYKQNLSQYEINKDYEKIKGLSVVEAASLIRNEVLSIEGNKAIKVYGITPSTLDAFEKNINIISIISKKKISLKDQKGVVITEKIAELLNLKKGDNITFNDSSGISHTIAISDICENYLYNYMYMSEDVYKKVYGYNLENNVMVVKYKNNITKEKLTTDIFKRGLYSSYISMDKYRNDNQKLIDSLDAVIYLIIISAGLLSFVVLYNLSKINISERTVEVATLKVLGYNSKKINKYINFEISVLTFIGIFIGIFAGYYLTEIIVTTCELDFFMFYHGISYTSYIYGVILTIIFSRVINAIIRKDLKRISMTESLKRIEQ